MSGAFGKFPMRNPLRKGSPFNKTTTASPTRLVVIGGAAVALVAAAVGSTFLGAPDPIPSSAAKMPEVNALPGGPITTPNERRLALKHDQQEAKAAEQRGVSYTPPMAPSRPISVQDPVDPIAPLDIPLPLGSPAALPAAARDTPPPVIVKPAVAPATFRPAPAEMQPIQHVAQTNQGESPEDQAFRAYVASTMAGWGSRPSQTDVVIDPARHSQSDNSSQDEGATDRSQVRSAGTGERRETSVAPASPMAQRLSQRVLIPAGRGVYGHTVLAVNSDTGGPIVLQADSGPIAGDRMVGTFSRAGQSDLLVVKITSIVHDGQTITADGVVIAPDTMETAVASSVDQHYVSRFLLPAAAAFVQGLGQAFATTSNTQSVLSPLGGAAYSTQLNLNQQLGVGAGVAAGRIGAALDQSAPRNSTVNLAANASVGIMFLSSVAVPNR